MSLPPGDPSPAPPLKNASHTECVSSFLAQEYEIIETSVLADVTLFCNNSELKAHRIVLSHYSDFFNSIFQETTNKHHDVFLEGFNCADIERVLTFMYTGNIIWTGGTAEKHSLIDVAESLSIVSLSNLLKESDMRKHHEGDKPDQSPRGDGGTSPVSVWQKCPVVDVCEDEHMHFEDEDEFYELELPDRKIEERGGGGPPEEDEEAEEDEDEEEERGTPREEVSKRRKQARPQRHKPTPPHSRSQSPDDLSVSSEEYLQNSYDEDSTEPPPNPPTPQPVSPHLQTPPAAMLPLIPQHQSSPPTIHPIPPPPPHFLFLRSMMNQSQMGQPHHPPPPPPHYFQPQHALKKLQCGPKGLWGKLMNKNPGGVFHHGSSRAQHSAPRGGPPRAWSNQDLTEALHNVWNKKMTTSQASRIFGIPYNSLLMYVRGKYGKSLKLDLLKKGLDLALLEKQKKAAQQAQASAGQQQQQQQNGTTPACSSSRELATTTQAQQRSPLEWGNKILDRGGQGMFHAGVFFGGNLGGRQQEIGK